MLSIPRRAAGAKPAAGATQKQISRRALETTGVSRQAHRYFERCFPLTPPSPLGRGRIASRARDNPERLHSSRRGTRCSLSLRERARVRGNETPPTKTAGRILQAQLDRLSEPRGQVAPSCDRRRGANLESDLE